MTCLLLIILSVLCFTNAAVSTGIMFDAASLPTDNWLELPTLGNQEEGMLKLKSSCIAACILRGEECHGFELRDDGTCKLGQIQVFGENNYIPEYVMNGKRVYLRSGMVQRKAVTGVTHLASLRTGNTYDTPFEDTRFSPLALPPPFSGGIPIITTNYKGGFLSCMGKDENGDYLKKCRHWTFRTEEWRDLPGELIYNHYRGAAVYTGGKLYAFCGTPENKIMTATVDAEVYDFNRGVWEDLPKAPSDYKVDGLHALALSDTKILLVGGRWPGVGYTRASYIYDTEAKTYTHAGDRDTGVSQGFSYMGCVVLPGGLRVICAGGTNDWHGGTARVHIFDVETKIWDTQPSYDLPYAGTGSMITLGPRVFYIRSTEDILEYKEGENPLWVPLPDTRVKHHSNIFYTMDYNELLI